MFYIGQYLTKVVSLMVIASCFVVIPHRVEAIQLITGELPPYSSATMKHGGELTNDIIKVLNETSYQNIKLSYQPWPRGLKNLELGNAVGAFPFTWTSERGQYLYYSVPITFDIQSWYTTPDKKLLEHSSWKGRIACVPKGWFSDAIDTVIHHQTLIVRTTNRLSQCIELLKKRRVDLVSINDTSLDSLPVSSHSDIYKLSLYRQNVTYYLVAPKTAEGHAFIDAFNNAWLASPLKKKWM